MKLKRTCPICDCEDGNKLYGIDFAKSKSEFIPEHYDIVYCSNCGFIFSDTKWIQKDYDKYYSTTQKYLYMYSDKHGGVSEEEAKKYNKQIDRIEKYVNKDANILEIGCGKGGLLMNLKKRGFNNLCGLDVSSFEKNILIESNIDYISSSFFDMHKIDKKFDCIISSEVIEHIYDLKSLVNNIYNILNDNGIIYIDVPNSSEYSSHFIKPFHYFDIEHINHFDINSISNLFIKFEMLNNGWYSEQIIDDKRYPTLYSIFRKSINNKQINKDYSNIKNINEYINISKEKENYKIGTYFLWGFGAYLRRLLLDDRYFNGINIAGIIDKNKSLSGLKIKNYKNEELEIFTPEILENYKDANIIITSSLFSEQIRNDLLNNNFVGKIYEIDRAEQSRAEQSRAEQSRAEQSRAVMFEYAYRKTA
ncbi:methyltransferase domain-containing protein [Brachyspira aalborgi]|uniref:class I SAM-dependent methyltransferase n=1 Tax=Brachyspira aalborgi TaxID=29522 RepID=UPI0011CC7473|nr:class I SAM-dependent methyltransferase [Brachyspira aalborgi]TXJ14876.1 methyltransferase domain-containing protein [Brachyspira aalborgi]TXJ18488.1 methyltransferase domain-containing protein [Brachyspira aalborgi]